MLLRYKDIYVGSFWCHVKTGNVYVVIFIANAEGDGEKEKYPATIVYANITKEKWDKLLDTMDEPERSAKIDTHGTATVKVWSGAFDDWHCRMRHLPLVGRMNGVQNRITHCIITHCISDILNLLGGEQFDSVK